MSPEKFGEILHSSIITGFTNAAKILWAAAWPCITVLAIAVIIWAVCRIVKRHR